MKKLFIVLALACVSMTSMAQETADPTLKYSVATNSFWSNWFIQAGADWNAWYSSEEHGLDLDKSPFKKFRSNPGASIAIGKWFTPGIGLRTKVQGIWGKQVTDANNDGNGNKYWIAQEQVMFNMSNLLCGYNPNRVWNVSLFGGGGVGRSMTYNYYAIGLGVGVQSLWNITRHFGVYAELGWNRFESDLDGADRSTDGHRGWDSHDNNMYAELGLNFNLGKASWEKNPDVEAIKALSQSQIDALQAQLNDANAENARLKNLLANQKPSTQTVKEFVGLPVNVFFNINKSTIASRKDLVNVKTMADYAKDNGTKLLVTGYADSKTGNKEINQKLSEARAKTVADELVKMGVSRDNITTAAKGGVSILSPISYDRRATVEIVK